MRMLNLFKLNNKIKKSHVLLIGSFFVFIGAISLTWNYLSRIRNEIFEDMRIAMMDIEEPQEEEVVEDIPVVEKVDKKEENNIWEY